MRGARGENLQYVCEPLLGLASRLLGVQDSSNGLHKLSTKYGSDLREAFVPKMQNRIQE